MELYLELTAKCALACPECPRTKNFGAYSVTEMSLGTLDLILDPAQPLEYIVIGGNHGDPIYHSQFHAAIERIKQHPSRPRVSIETNGAHRSADWWRKTATLLDAQDRLSFSIDGLESTNKRYRINSDWDSVMTAVKTVRQASDVVLIWKWILFRQNEHEIQRGLDLARTLGFDRFRLIHSNRVGEQGEFRPTLKFSSAAESLEALGAH